MYTLFNNGSRLKQTNIATYGLDYVKRELMNNQVERYRQYRAINPGYLKNDHILQRLIGMIDIPFMGDLPDYYLRVGTIVNRIAGQMGMVCSAHHGRINDQSYFYGKGVSEILIAISDDEITPADIWFKWRTMSAIRVLAHPVMGCTVAELDGTQELKGLKPGATAVLEINIPLLACQYHLWRMATAGLSPIGTMIPTAHFLTQVVLPNMITSHLDVAVLNTLHYLTGAEEYATLNTNLPFFMADYYPKMEAGLLELMARFSRETYLYAEILRNIPVFGDDNLLETVKLPDIAFTNQTIWALMIARLPVIALLLRFDELSRNVKNDADRNRIRRSLIEADSAKYLTNGVPSGVANQVAIYIDKHIRPLL